MDLRTTLAARLKVASIGWFAIPSSGLACQIPQYLPGEDFVDLPVSRHRLRFPTSRIVIYVVPTSMTKQDTPGSLEL
jgi:hypothetical protein